MNREYSNQKAERISLTRELVNVGKIRDNTVYFTMNKNGSGLSYSTKHHDRNGRAYDNRTRGTIKQKLEALDKAGATNRIFTEKTKGNLYLDRDGKVRTHEQVEKGLFGKMLIEHLDNYKETWEREKHNGMTLSEIRELYAAAIDNTELSNTKKRVLHRELQEAKTEAEMFERVIKSGKVEKIFETKTHKNLIKWRSRARTFEEYIAGAKNRRVFDEIIVSLPEDKMIERGAYTPAYDATKITNHDELIFDGTSDHPVKYYGVKSYDRDEMESIIKTQVEAIEKILNEYLGELPKGMKRVAAAVMHVDEKTPHIHITYSNLEYVNEKFKHSSKKVMGASYEERVLRVTELKNVITERTRELGYELENHIAPDRTKAEKIKLPKKKSVKTYHKNRAKASIMSKDRLLQTSMEAEMLRERQRELQKESDVYKNAVEKAYKIYSFMYERERDLTAESFEFHMWEPKNSKGERIAEGLTKDLEKFGIKPSQMSKELENIWENNLLAFEDRYEKEIEKTREYEWERSQDEWER